MSAIGWVPDVDPLDQQWASALVAVVPVLAMLLTLGVLRWRAYRAGLVSWALAVVTAVAVFGMPVGAALATSAHGFVYGVFPIAWILVCAIWMYQVTVVSGRFDDLRRVFDLLSDDPRVLGLVVAFCFGGLLEALAGFGAPVAIVATMLVALGFGKLRAAVTALVANTVPVAFGAVGLPVLMAARTAGLPVGDVAPITGRLTALLCLVVPFMLLLIMDGRRGLAECWPVGLFIGVVFGTTKWIVSATPLYNLTEVFASVVSVVLTVLLLKVWHPRGGAAALARIGDEAGTGGTGHGEGVPAARGTGRRSAARPAPQPGTATATLDRPVAARVAEPVAARVAAPAAPALGAGRIAMALVPYLLVIVVFAVTATPAVSGALARTDITVPWPGLGGLLNAAGEPAAHQHYTLQLLSTPGTALAVVALLVGAIYRVRPRVLVDELVSVVVRMRFSILTIGCVVALAFVMGDSGQTLALGLWIAGAGAAYPFLAPTLGAVGTYVTGSDTSANILFSGLQASVGGQLGHPDLLVGANAAGGVVGKMIISPQSLTIAATAIGVVGSESTLLRRVLPWCLTLLLVMCLLTGLMSTPVLGWLLP